MAWNHPHMPWDGAELWVCALAEDGTPRDQKRVAGGGGESVFQPAWSPDGTLHFVSDPKGWWNIFRWTGTAVEPVLEMPAEFGRPLWALGSATYAFAADGRIVCSYAQNGFWQVGLIEPGRGKLEAIASPYSAVFDLRAEGHPGGAHRRRPVPPDRGRRGRSALRPAHRPAGVEQRAHRPEVRLAPGTDGVPDGGRPDRARPVLPAEKRRLPTPPGELPPLIVKVHGGPTSATTAALNLNTQFWTSRGFAVVDVNYGGSTGYGTAYRNRLKEKWGVVDLDDAVHAAQFLARAGRVDGRRMAISGGSAGGYTVLCALTFRNVFQAGTSLYGISDLEVLLRDTHKFESKYLRSGWSAHTPRRRTATASDPPCTSPTRSAPRSSSSGRGGHGGAPEPD